MRFRAAARTPPRCTLRERQPGYYVFEGELGFAAAEQILPAVSARIAAAVETTLDLGGVSRADSAALALLLEWQRLAQGSGRVLRYVNLPSQLRAIAHVAGVEEILGMIAGVGGAA
jgi:phospholipid transport system transporter-binding protein